MSRSDSKETVNIAVLKAKLAQYLRMVRSGREVIVTDHRQPVARIVPVEPSESSLETIKAKGRFQEISKPKIPAQIDGKSIDSLSFLLKERGNR